MVATARQVRHVGNGNGNGGGIKNRIAVDRLEKLVLKDPKEALTAEAAETMTPSGKNIIRISACRYYRMDITIVGETSLVCNEFNAKSLLQMLGDSMGSEEARAKIAPMLLRMPRVTPELVKRFVEGKLKGTAGDDDRDPWEEFLNSLYWYSARPPVVTQKDIEAGKFQFGIPTSALKACFVEACRLTKKEIPMTIAKPALRTMNGDLALLQAKPPIMDMRYVRNPSSGKTTLRFRGEFKEWACTFRVKFMAHLLTPSAVLTLYSYAGSVGLLEMRPGAKSNNSGTHGTFHVDSTHDVQLITSAF